MARCCRARTEPDPTNWVVRVFCRGEYVGYLAHIGGSLALVEAGGRVVGLALEPGVYEAALTPSYMVGRVVARVLYVLCRPDCPEEAPAERCVAFI